MESTPEKDNRKTCFRDEARRLGFDAAGVASIEPKLRRGYYLEWIKQGRHGDMAWMERNHDRRLNPKKVLPEARSILCLGLNYYQPNRSSRGRIARYALGMDYHEVMIGKLEALCRWLRAQGGVNRPYIDTGPVLEKPIAAHAGIGWQAKNTMLIHPKFGNWLFLGEIFTTLYIPPDQPQPDRCGKCTACVDACPTKAITAPYKLDATRCIAYLTIEHQGSIPVEFRRAIGDRVFGCDECLDVCPWNRWARKTRESRLQAHDYPDIRQTLTWTDEEFRTHFRHTPLFRLKRKRWLRNVCVVLGNIGDASDLPALRVVSQASDSMVAEHADWAISQIESRHRIRARNQITHPLNL